MEYMTVKEAGDKWGLGIRIVTLYCAEGRIDGAVKKGNLWLLPKNAAKPQDRRQKKGLIPEKKEAGAIENRADLSVQDRPEGPGSFQQLYDNKDLFVQIVKQFPYPMHICAADGTLLLANDAFLEFAKITNPSKLYGKHNILSSLSLEKWGVKDFVSRAFQGETVSVNDVKVPYQEIVELLGDNKELISGTMFHNMTAFPIRGENNQLLYVVIVFTTSRYYQDKEEIILGKEYIDNHWKEEFDPDKLASIVYMSRYHYARLFKQHTGMTPYNYYKEVKMNKLKEKLCDYNLSITQAFEECGVDYNGNFAKKFKQKFGITPSRYRAMMTKKNEI